MRVRAAGDRWSLQISEIFEAASNRLIRNVTYDVFIDLLNDFEDRASLDPRELGEEHLGLEPAGRFWVYQSPPLSRIPKFAILYEIDDGMKTVRLWNLHLL
jgi:hypothetical protein